jgi:Macrocin-O-methyltransferase (TylF)
MASAIRQFVNQMTSTRWVSRSFKAFVKQRLARAGIHAFRTPLRYAQDGLVTIHNDHFRRAPGFLAAYRRGLKAGGGVDPAFEWRVHVALWAAKTSLGSPGDFIECGVNAGFVSSAIMHWLNWNGLNRRFFLVDTWAGPPINQYNGTEIEHGRRRVAEDAMAAGAYVTDLDRVRRNFDEWPNSVIVQGTVPDILPRIPAAQVAFLHLDMNCAYPERVALEFFWKHLSPGAIVLLDDYTHHGYEEQAVAMDAAARAIGADILSLPTGQGVIVR